VKPTTSGAFKIIAREFDRQNVINTARWKTNRMGTCSIWRHHYILFLKNRSKQIFV